MSEIKPKPYPFCGSTDVESCPGGERGWRARVVSVLRCLQRLRVYRPDHQNPWARR